MVLKECTRCMVYTLEKRQVANARVVKAKGGVTLYFDDYTMGETQMKGWVHFFDKQAGLIVALCEISIHMNPGYPEDHLEPWMGDCRIVEVKGVVQRQQDIRAKLDLDMVFRSDDYLEFWGAIENISAGGMYITTPQPLNKDEVITFKYAFDNQVREYKAVALWVKRVFGGRYGYGCKFLKMSSPAEAAIRSFVYKRLLEMKRKEGL